ncbi:hypothetical protein T4A_6921 [Trichinella pseudospiralis]|uniref:Uncharacterized protein n=1 Tax=Trichinella pseudospiralis TaxID=6337 RepID=A0A0V1AR90_TRIPS|nr:hypothetical protein T4A_6921 [Trichinella pseudospiralis]
MLSKSEQLLANFYACSFSSVSSAQVKKIFLKEAQCHLL